MMKTFENKNTNPKYNLALEEFLCNEAKNKNLEFFMLWQNEPSVIIGRFQNNIDEIIDVSFAEKNNIQIVRRNSGGGAVYHDLGNINYSFILKDEKNFTLEYFSKIIMKTLENIGVNAKLEFSHNDIKADNLKISGTAQFRHNGILLHHGTLLFDTDLIILSKVLKKSSGNITNLKPLLQKNLNIMEFLEILYSQFKTDYFSLSKENIYEINNLMRVKYLNSDWNLRGVFNAI